MPTRRISTVALKHGPGKKPSKRHRVTVTHRELTHNGKRPCSRPPEVLERITVAAPIHGNIMPYSSGFDIDPTDDPPDMPIAPIATPAPILLIQLTPSPGGQRPVAPPLRPVHMPDNLKHVTHVRIKRSKPGPLGHQYEGPFEIVQRLGNARLKLRVGSKANGDPRYEVWNWEDCKPAVLDERLPPPTVERPRRVRRSTTPGKPKTPDKFYPTTDLAVPDDGLDDLTDEFLPDAPPVITRFGRRGNKPTRLGF